MNTSTFIFQKYRNVRNSQLQFLGLILASESMNVNTVITQSTVLHELHTIRYIHDDPLNEWHVSNCYFYLSSFGG